MLSPATETDHTADPKAGGWEAITQLATAIGAGIGVIGFVTAFGGGVVWARAKAMGLPSNEVVAIVPKGVLVATGAAFLVPAVGLALIVPAVLLLFDKVANARGHLSARKLQKEAEEADTQAADARRLGAELDSEIRGRVAAISDLGAPGSLDAATIERGAELLAELREFMVERQTLAAELKQRESDARDRAYRGRARLTELSATQRATRILTGGLVLWFAQASFAWATAGDLSFGQKLALVGVALLTTTVSVVLYQGADRIGWFLLAAFVSTGVFLGLLTYDRTLATPKVEPAAVVQSDGTAFAGYFIARTSDRAYVATVATKKSPSRMVEIVGTKVESVSVGPLLNPGLAAARAKQNARDLCTQRDRLAKPPPKPKSGKATKPKPCKVIG